MLIICNMLRYRIKIIDQNVYIKNEHLLLQTMCLFQSSNSIGYLDLYRVFRKKQAPDFRDLYFSCLNSTGKNICVGFMQFYSNLSEKEWKCEII